jgi:hypothetical protein
MSNNVHVSPGILGGWVIKKEGMLHPLSRHPVFGDAVLEASVIAEQQKSSLVIHDRDGQVRLIEAESSAPTDSSPG